MERLKAQKSLGILPTSDIKKHLLGSDRELVALRQGLPVLHLIERERVCSMTDLLYLPVISVAYRKTAERSERQSEHSIGQITHQNYRRSRIFGLIDRLIPSWQLG